MDGIYDVREAVLEPHSVQRVTRGSTGAKKVEPIEFMLSDHHCTKDDGPNIWERFRYRADEFRLWLATTCCACLSSVPSFALVIIAAVLVLLLISTIPLAFALTYMKAEPVTSDSSLNANIAKDNEFIVERAGGSGLWPSESTLQNYQDWEEHITLQSSSLLPPNVTSCSVYGFACTGQPHIVIPKNRRCDGHNDCPDGSDEKDCHECQTTLSCPATKDIHSGQKLCISAEHLCDGHAFCPNGEDEDPKIYCRSECDQETEYACIGADICVPTAAVCDGEKHCPFGDDETKCADAKCKNGAKKCGDRCLPKREICDGTPDCVEENGSDEVDCDCTTCSGKNSALCDGEKKLCIDKKRVCDGQRDCPGGEDEHDCPGVCTAPPKNSNDEDNDNADANEVQQQSSIRCSDGKVYDWYKACGGLVDSCRWSCKSCNLELGFRCRMSKSNASLPKESHGEYNSSSKEADFDETIECIHRSLVCDGKIDCSDSSDEANCECSTEDFIKCQKHGTGLVSRRCYQEEQKCDGYEDCVGGEDERNCTECKNGAFLCARESRCLSSVRRCNGRMECLDGSDEHDCTCEECNRQPTPMYMCTEAQRCFPLDKVCSPYSLCPNATQLDKLFCAARGNDYF